MKPATEAAGIGRHPFFSGLREGTISRDAIRRYAIDTWLLSITFPRRLAALIAMCENDAVRAELLHNLLEEEGFVARDGALTQDAERRHYALSRRFALAAGATDDELQASLRDARATWVDGAITSGRLVAALAYLTVGFEGFVPDAYALLIEAFEAQYRFSSHDLEFFYLHRTADAAHADAGAKLVASLVRTDQDREEAREGVQHARTAWWWWHRRYVA